jgi:hypothetical protein
MQQNESLQKQGTPDWPECWLFYRRGEPVVEKSNKLGDRIECGELVMEKNGMIRYRCLCGSEFERVEGCNNEEAQMWVAAHVKHVTTELETKACDACTLKEQTPFFTGCMRRTCLIAKDDWFCNGQGKLSRRRPT